MVFKETHGEQSTDGRNLRMLVFIEGNIAQVLQNANGLIFAVRAAGNAP